MLSPDAATGNFTGQFMQSQGNFYAFTRRHLAVALDLKLGSLLRRHYRMLHRPENGDKPFRRSLLIFRRPDKMNREITLGRT